MESRFVLQKRDNGARLPKQRTFKEYVIHDEIKCDQARALIQSVDRDEPQIYLGRSADVEETEDMSTPTEERGDLQIRNLWKHQTECVVSRILMRHRT